MWEPPVKEKEHTEPNPGGFPTKFPTKKSAHTELAQGEENKTNPTTQTSHEAPIL